MKIIFNSNNINKIYLFIEFLNCYFESLYKLFQNNIYTITFHYVDIIIRINDFPTIL